MIALEPDTKRKLVGALRLLGSDKSGEQLAALNAVQRLLPAGVTLADYVEGISPVSSTIPPRPKAVDPRDCWGSGEWMRPWRRQARQILERHSAKLTDREADFLMGIARRDGPPTTKQADWLKSLTGRFPVGGTR